MWSLCALITDCSRHLTSVLLHKLLAEIPQLLAASIVARVATDLIPGKGPEAAVVQEEVLALLLVVLCLITSSTASASGALPAVVAAGLTVLRISDAGRQPTARLLVAHVRAGDGLLEVREELLEDGVVLAEEAGLGNAAWVHGREDDARLLVVPAVELAHEHHVADLAVLVRLGAAEGPAIDHGGRGLHPLLETLEIADSCHGGNHAAQLLVVDARGDRSQDHAARGLHEAVLQVLQEELAEQEVAKVVGGKLHLVPVCRPPRAATGEETGKECPLLVRVGEVQRSVADERVQRTLERAERPDKLADAVVGREVAVEDLVAAFWEAVLLRDHLSFHKVAAGHDDEPVAPLCHLLGAGKANTRRCAGDDDSLLVRRLEWPHGCPHGRLLLPGSETPPPTCCQTRKTDEGAERHCLQRRLLGTEGRCSHAIATCQRSTQAPSA
mmetsp:Transcript_87104/g.254910  ORF Transcript_87104/g.254910 Transcript_87104/m.254910 type:complete len:442 (+) Transcript_87104:267-1592(+)